jgi:hypothetical protein
LANASAALENPKAVILDGYTPGRIALTLKIANKHFGRPKNNKEKTHVINLGASDTAIVLVKWFTAALLVLSESTSATTQTTHTSVIKLTAPKSLAFDSQPSIGRNSILARHTRDVHYTSGVERRCVLLKKCG